MQEVTKVVKQLEKRLKELVAVVDFKTKRKEVLRLEKRSMEKDLWQDPNEAKATMLKLKDLTEEIKALESLTDKINSFKELIQSAEGQEEQELYLEAKNLEAELAKLEIAKYLSGPYDRSGGILMIHAGQGGVEAMDWTAMLKRMYLRYCEKKGWQVTVVSER